MNEEEQNLLDEFEKRDRVAKKFRETARQIWALQPKISIEEMLNRFELTTINREGLKYSEHELRDWVCPDAAATEEFPRFRNLKSWRIEEAVALWLNINPFVIMQLTDHELTFSVVILAPIYRDHYTTLLNLAKDAIRSHTLLSQHEDYRYYVQSRNFYEWAIINVGEPSGSSEDFFSELAQEWRSNKEVQIVSNEHSIVDCDNALDSIVTAPSVSLRSDSKISPDIFDLLPPHGIAKMFKLDLLDTKNNAIWKKLFERAKRVGLDKARRGSKPHKYCPLAVADWLVEGGKMTREKSNRVLSNNLPARSIDCAYLFNNDNS